MLPSPDNKGQYPSFAWPGGYPIIYHTADNCIICPTCASSSEFSTQDPEPSYKLVDSDLHMEGKPIICDHCSKEVESAYGPIKE